MTNTTSRFTYPVGYRCPEDGCSVERPAAYRIVDHATGKHGRNLSVSDIPPVTATINDPAKLLESLYNINKHAKKYARLGCENYQKGKKATAKMNSVKKNALYELKHQVLKRLAEGKEHDRIQKHQIDDNVFVCLYLTAGGQDWSFHTPQHQWTGPCPEGDIRVLDDFEANETKSRSDMPLKEALLTIESKTGLSANQYLEEEYIDYGRNSHFSGWSYLDS
jgi:hypothetical protein